MGQLRQNPTQMLRDVAGGQHYTVMRYGQGIAQITPIPSGENPFPPEKTEPTRTRHLKPVALPKGYTPDTLLEEMRGEW